MILPKSPNIRRMVSYVGRPLLFLFVWDVLVVVAYQALHWHWLALSIPLALYGSALGIVVGFRNNSSYSRWWEARTLWGSIVNNSRSLARQVCSTMHAQRAGDREEGRRVEELQQRLVYYQIAFVHALRQHLRGLDPFETVKMFLSDEEIADLRKDGNVPLGIQLRIGQMLREARDRHWIDPLEWQAMDRNLDDLMDAQGGAERIKNTPIPKQYDYFPMLFVRLYCVLLPSGMVADLGWFTPLGSTVLGFLFLALDKTGRDLENPFENTIHDVPMTAIATTIEANLRQILKDNVPVTPVKPVRGVLW